MLQTNNVDAQCEKLATELRWQRFALKVASFQLLHLHLTYPTCIWHLLGWQMDGWTERHTMTANTRTSKHSMSNKNQLQHTRTHTQFCLTGLLFWSHSSLDWCGLGSSNLSGITGAGFLQGAALHLVQIITSMHGTKLKVPNAYRGPCPSWCTDSGQNGRRILYTGSLKTAPTSRPVTKWTL